MKKWQIWVGIGATLLVFFLSQAFLFGQFAGSIRSDVDTNTKKIEKHIDEAKDFVKKGDLKTMQQDIKDIRNYLLEHK